MLEVVFGDSEKGMMQAIKAGPGGICGIGLIGESEMAAQKVEELLKIEEMGEIGETVCLGQYLDVGALKGGYDGAGRRETLRRLWGQSGFGGQDLELYFKSLRNDMQRFHSAIEHKESIRIWVNGAPGALCGLFFAGSLLWDSGCQVAVAPLSKLVRCFAGENSPKRAQEESWPVAQPGEICSAQLRFFLERWRALERENAPLRAWVNGELLSVPEDFYDFLLRRHLPEGEFSMARLIGELMKRHPEGACDSWYALRIRKMVEQKELLIVGKADSEHPYGSILKKA